MVQVTKNWIKKSSPKLRANVVCRLEIRSKLLHNILRQKNACIVMDDETYVKMDLKHFQVLSITQNQLTNTLLLLKRQLEFKNLERKYSFGRQLVSAASEAVHSSPTSP